MTEDELKNSLIRTKHGRPKKDEEVPEYRKGIKKRKRKKLTNRVKQKRVKKEPEPEVKRGVGRPKKEEGFINRKHVRFLNRQRMARYKDNKKRKEWAEKNGVEYTVIPVWPEKRKSRLKRPNGSNHNPFVTQHIQHIPLIPDDAKRRLEDRATIVAYRPKQGKNTPYRWMTLTSAYTGLSNLFVVRRYIELKYDLHANTIELMLKFYSYKSGFTNKDFYDMPRATKLKSLNSWINAGYFELKMALKKKTGDRSAKIKYYYLTEKARDIVKEFYDCLSKERPMNPEILDRLPKNVQPLNSDSLLNQIIDNMNYEPWTEEDKALWEIKPYEVKKRNISPDRQKMLDRKKLKMLKKKEKEQEKARLKEIEMEQKGLI